MSLIPAGQQIRQLMEALEHRAAPPGSGSYRAPGRSDTTPEQVAAAWAAHCEPVFTGWQEHRPVSELPERPLTAAQIRAVVVNTYSADQRTWARADPDDQPLLVLVAAVRVTDLHRGLYTIGPAGADAFEFISAGASAPDIGGGAEDAGAAALLYICGDLAAACQPDGSGYGALLVRAGAFGQVAWLAAIAAGLAGATYGRASHRVTAAARPLGDGLCHLLTVAVGPSPTPGPGLS